MNNIKDIDFWDKILNYLENYLSKEEIELWFKQIKLVEYKNNNLILEIPNIFFKNWVDENCINLLQNYFKLNFDVNIKIHYKIVNIDTNNEKLISSDNNYKNKKNIKNIFNVKYTFNNFVIGKSNRFAEATCEAVAKSPFNTYNPLFIYGGVGLGKTHLLHAIGNFLNVNNSKLKVLYITAEQFMNRMVESIKNSKNLEFREKYRNLDVLLVDDIQFIAGKETTQEEFFHTFDSLRHDQKQIVITSDVIPKNIPNLEERLRSRFEWGVMAGLETPDYETRCAIVKQKAENLNINISEEILNYIALKIKLNIRTLEGALLRILAFSNINHLDINLTLAKEVLGDFEQNLPIEKILNIDIIQKVTAKNFNIAEKDIIGKSRLHSVTLPRQIAIYIIKELLPLSIMDIGRKFGNRDHTSIMYAYNKIKTKMKEDPYFNALVNKIISEIKNNI